MSPAADTVRRLRGAIAAAALMLGAGAAIGGYAWYRSGEHARHRAELRQSAGESSRQLSALREEARRIEAYAARHAELTARGSLGEFRKTVEVDRFEKAARALRRPDGSGITRYTLKARAALPAGADGALARHTVSMQPLSFEAIARHEADFLRVWSGIAESIGGLSAMEGCELALAAGVGATSVSARAPATDGRADRPDWPVLRVNCSVVWYVFEPRAEEVVAPGAPIPGLSLPAGLPRGGRS
jgi:hypothetical protein